MLPENNVEEIATEENAYKAFYIDFDTKTVGELIDGKDALVQAVKIALMTQRYKYAVFSHSYGTDYENAFADGYAKAMGRLKNAIYDSLIYDDRINAVDSFTFERQGTKVIVKFRILSIYGPIRHEIEVS